MDTTTLRRLISQEADRQYEGPASEERAPSQPEIVMALQRILDSGYLGQSDRLQNILDYLVKEELAGRGGRIKAYAIATEVLGRSADFNPSTDSIVRVEMARLRRALDLFAAGDGRFDPVQIRVEKGSYRPLITRNSVSRPPVPRAGLLTPRCLPVLVILMLAALFAGLVISPGRDELLSLLEPPPNRLRLHLHAIGDTELARSYVTHVDEVLRRFETFDVRSSDVLHEPFTLPEDYLLDVLVQEETLALFLRRGADGRSLYTYIAPRSVAPDPEGEPDLPNRIGMVAAGVAAVDGPIWADYLAAPGANGMLACGGRLLRKVLGKGMIEDGDCLQPGMLAHAPAYFLALEALSASGGLQSGNPEAALSAMRRAGAERRPSALANYALFLAELERGQIASAMVAARNAERLNPENAALISRMGQELALRGFPRQALKFLRSAVARKGTPDAQDDFALFLAHFQLGNEAGMQEAADRLDGTNEPGQIVARLIAVGPSGDQERMRALRGKLRDALNAKGESLAGYLDVVGLGDSVSAQLMAALRNRSAS